MAYRYDADKSFHNDKITTIIFAAIQIIVTFIMVYSSKSFAVLIGILIFDVLLILVRCCKKYDKLKIVMYSSSLVIFFVTVAFNEIPYYAYMWVAFYIPILCIYAIPRLTTSVASGFMICFTFLLYIDCYEQIGELTGNCIAIVVCSFLTGLLAHFIIILTEQRDKYKKISITDQLTHAYNLNHILQVGGEALKNGKSLAVYVLDIDRFKQFNDTYGHLVGNKVLVQVANILIKSTNGMSAYVGRLGGDEYILLLIGYDEQVCNKFFSKLNLILSMSLVDCDKDLKPVNISCSIGMSFAPQNTKAEFQDILHYADENMYYNKEKNRNALALKMQFYELLPSRAVSLLYALAEKDMYSYVHSQYVVQYCLLLARALKLPEEAIKELCIGAWVHDIGKITIPNEVLRKRGNLSIEEYELIKTHVEFGVNLLQTLNLSEIAVNSIKYHHERQDGKGYPYGLSEQEIPIEARIIQIADAFSAMTVKRVYREIMTTEDALEEILKNSGVQFDKDTAKTFVDLFKHD